MPSNSSGWFWHVLARETRRLGHLFSPGGQRGPYAWLPYALDNGAFSCWDRDTNTFDHAKWATTELAWRHLLFWSQLASFPPLWAIVPDIPGNGPATLERWPLYAPEVQALGFPLALAVQNGMTVAQVRVLDPAPAVICIGGDDEFKWGTVEEWCAAFPRVHFLRCNKVAKLPNGQRPLDYLFNLGVESIDGTGWNRGDRGQTRHLEEWCIAHTRTTPRPAWPLWPHVCRREREKAQTTFA